MKINKEEDIGSKYEQFNNELIQYKKCGFIRTYQLYRDLNYNGRLQLTVVFNNGNTARMATVKSIDMFLRGLCHGIGSSATRFSILSDQFKGLTK